MTSHGYSIVNMHAAGTFSEGHTEEVHRELHANFTSTEPCSVHVLGELSLEVFNARPGTRIRRHSTAMQPRDSLQINEILGPGYDITNLHDALLALSQKSWSVTGQAVPIRAERTSVHFTSLIFFPA